MRHRRIDEIASGRVQNAFRFTGRSRRIENEQRIFRIHFGVGTIWPHMRGFALIMKITTRRHIDIGASACDDNDALMFLMFGRELFERGVDVAFERHAATAAHAFIGGDRHAARRIFNTPGERIGRETAEHNRVNGADARACEHCEGGFRNHRQINRHAIAFAHAMIAQHIGEATNLLVQFTIGDMARDGGIVAFPDDRDFIGTRHEMPIDAVHRNIGGAVFKPFDRHIMRIETCMFDFGEGRNPVDPLRLLRPKAIGIARRRCIACAIGLRVNQRGAFPVFRNGMNFIVHESRRRVTFREASARRRRVRQVQDCAACVSSSNASGRN